MKAENSLMNCLKNLTPPLLAGSKKERERHQREGLIVFETFFFLPRLSNAAYGGRLKNLKLIEAALALNSLEPQNFKHSSHF